MGTGSAGTLCFLNTYVLVSLPLCVLIRGWQHALLWNFLSTHSPAASRRRGTFVTYNGVPLPTAGKEGGFQSPKWEPNFKTKCLFFLSE